jgi:hypothetical protein
VLSSTTTTITGAEDSFEGAGDDVWTTNPAADDYVLVLLQDSNNGMDLKWRSNKIVFSSFRSLKTLVEGFVRIYGQGTATLRWAWDGGAGGSENILLTQGEVLYDSDDVWDTAYWTAVQTLQSEFTFPENEGRNLEITLELTTSNHFNLTEINFSYQANNGQGWKP